MNEHYDDYEQGEAVKKWLGENMAAIILGIGVGLAGLFGWQFWERKQENARLAGAEALATLVANDTAASNQDLDVFLEGVDSVSYATLAALHLSGKAMADDNVDEAIALLERVAGKGEPPVMRMIASLRLARLQMERGELDIAEGYVSPLLTEQGFAGLASEIHGDLLLARGDRAAARAAYQKALDEIGGGDRALLQMKLDDLAVATTKES